jgi:hypothetical protein
LKKSERTVLSIGLMGIATSVSIPLAIAIGNYWVILYAVLIAAALSGILFLATRGAEE